ncbi:hypothetical protein EA663_14330 [Pseudoxanthomonas winnipegensis]|nr:hypothetical protein EA663_14330 [Pseudoxanthomonas winnipegensis]
MLLLFAFGGLIGKASTPPHPSPALRAREGASSRYLPVTDRVVREEGFERPRKPKSCDLTRAAAGRRAGAATSEAGGRAPESGRDALIEGSAAPARRTAALPKPEPPTPRSIAWERATKKCRCQVFRANHAGLETVYGTVG